MVFGVSSSPFLLGGTIEYHLERMLQEVDQEEEKQIIRQLMTSFYVDNCITSVETESELFQFEDVAKRVMAKGRFDLRGWEYTGQADNETSTSVLGLSWNKMEDTLRLASSALQRPITLPVTKRKILATAQRVFDSIGVSSPVFLKPKLLLQKLWSHKITWDDEVPEDVRTDFLEWLQQL